MYLIEFKNIDNQDNIIQFNELLTLTEANTMLLEVINSYKEHGIKSKIWYEIIDKGSKEVIFSSRIIIFDDIVSLFEIIKNNRRIDDQIKEFVSQIELATEDNANAATVDLEEPSEENKLVEKEETQIIEPEGKTKQIREIEQTNNVQYEETLTSLEEQMKKTIVDLESIKKQNEQAELEREQERLKLEEERREMQKRVIQEMHHSTEANQQSSSISKIFVEKGQFITYVKQAIVVIKKATRVGYVKTKRALIKYRRNKQKQQALDIQLKKAKLEFINEIQTERKHQERATLREQRKREKTASSIKKKEERYIKELRKRKKGNLTIKKLIKIAAIVAIIGLAIDYFYNKDQSRWVYLQGKGIQFYQMILENLMD